MVTDSNPEGGGNASKSCLPTAIKQKKKKKPQQQ